MIEKLIGELKGLQLEQNDAILFVSVKVAELINGDNAAVAVSINGNIDVLTSALIQVLNQDDKISDVLISALLGSNVGRKKLVGYMLSVALRKHDTASDEASDEQVKNIDIDFLKNELGIA